MRRSEWRVGWGLAALVALTWAGARVGAQEVEEEERRCRCVDEAGNEIERCTCFRMPDLDEITVWPPMPARARIGISVDPEQEAGYDTQGVRVRDVLEDGPADRAGIREGDVITVLDGHDLSEPLEPELEEDFDLDRSIPVQRLLAVARRLEPDTEVEVELLRDGERRVLTVEAEEVLDRHRYALARPFAGEAFRRHMEGLGERMREHGDVLGELGRREAVVARAFEPRPFGSGSERFGRCPGSDAELLWAGATRCPGGLELAALNPELGSYFGATEGVLVTNVHEDSQIGLEPGDVLLAVGQREVDTPDRVRRILASYDPDEEISFRILREGTEMSVSGRLAPQ